ncbi:MAG: methyltransferase domain-containing protein [Thermomicrobiales bacterium]|nr:methyltransferase domain-containing protein [Thermomicrobiales bacterium]
MDTLRNEPNQPKSPGASSAEWGSDVSDDTRVALASRLEEQAADPFLQHIATRCLALLDLAPGERVLELGCGTGVFLPALATAVRPTGQVVGLDHNPGFLEEARQRVAATGGSALVTFEEADATRLPFPDASFDAVHVERVLMHLPDPDAALREVRRVLRPGGRFVAAEPDSAGVRTDHPDDPEAMALINAQDLVQVQQPAIGLELNRRMARAGFVERKVEVFTQFDPDYHPVAAAGDRQSAEELVAAGALDRARAEAALRSLEEANARGEYAWIASMVVALGRAPAVQP